MEARTEKIDAGTAGLDHYKSRLPKWRYVIRERLLPITRLETPYVALLQERTRSPALDTYFAWTANLGTHTCFMVALPILFWCGNPYLGRAMTTTLAAGVYFSGFIKDLLCLPRPLSPPLTRITMSGSAALEYGFPSSHSTNAVSVTVFSILLLRDPSTTISPKICMYLQILAYFYAVSIVLGRLYCGMHGFLDVVCGSLLGAIIAFGHFYLGPIKDEWMFSSTGNALLIIFLVIAVLVRIHPEPADDCPCFDDSVAFAAVVLGVDSGGWHFARTQYADASATYPGTVPFSISELGWPKVIARIVLGVVVVFVWRAVMKPLLLRTLPPIFRLIENLGLDLPRRYFKPASEYQTVPDQRDDDNVIPSARDIPHLLTNFRQRRAISIGPQSEADAYEALAYRQKRRRDSLREQNPSALRTEAIKDSEAGKDYFEPPKASHSRKRSLSLEEFRAQMGASADMLSPEAVGSPRAVDAKGSTGFSAEDEKDKSELFATVQKPRVRYDVEVITKLVVYCGIGWLAVEGNPILFHHVGLSL
ncbi:Long-chain base-1-phosphate phosphatase [Knufia obscura]|uniref:Long-chain base-1-phosphate phosphatase n=1 Tax=Knufia obscura TaxID=1635080 RepID=A0ABR0RNI4_9EURO|nr:Long-chain base-1-phosphate phosphatase [Knufia obscura]